MEPGGTAGPAGLREADGRGSPLLLAMESAYSAMSVVRTSRKPREPLEKSAER